MFSKFTSIIFGLSTIYVDLIGKKAGTLSNSGYSSNYFNFCSIKYSNFSELYHEMILVIKSTLMLEIKRFDLYCFGRFNIAAKVGNISAHAGPK